MTTLGPYATDCDHDVKLTLLGPSGSPVDLTGVSGLSARLTAGPGGAVAATLAASVLVAASGTVTVSLNATALAGVAPGTYPLAFRGTASGRPLDLAPQYQVTLVGGVGTDAATAGWTRAKLERIAVGFAGPKMAKVGMSTVTGGANPDLADAVSESLRAAGVEPSDPTAPTAAEFALVASTVPGGLMADVMKLATLETILGRWVRPDETRGTDSQAWGRFADGVQTQIDGLRKRLTDRYGYGVAPLTGGTISLNFGQPTWTE